MRITLLKPPHTAIGSRLPGELLPPLGLLAIGGPLSDAGHDLRLVNAGLHPVPLEQMVKDVLSGGPSGGAGRGADRPFRLDHCASNGVALAALIKRRAPDVTIVYGGVFPTYHWQDILTEAPQIDLILRGMGEETTVLLMDALQNHRPLKTVPGIAFRVDCLPYATRPAPIIADLDAHRIGWELINHADYSYRGGRRAVVLQFCRGCPHLCTYCGQRGFGRNGNRAIPNALPPKSPGFTAIMA